MMEFLKEAQEIKKKYPEIIEEYFEKIATNENFDKILSKFEELFGNENIVIDNVQPHRDCRKYQYIEVKFGDKEYEISFAFLDLDGLDAKFDMECYNEGKRYTLSPYFKDTFQTEDEIVSAAENIIKMRNEINKILGL